MIKKNLKKTLFTPMIWVIVAILTLFITVSADSYLSSDMVQAATLSAKHKKNKITQKSVTKKSLKIHLKSSKKYDGINDGAIDDSGDGEPVVLLTDSEGNVNVSGITHPNATIKVIDYGTNSIGNLDSQNKMGEIKSDKHGNFSIVIQPFKFEDSNDDGFDIMIISTLGHKHFKQEVWVRNKSSQYMGSSQSTSNSISESISTNGFKAGESSSDSSSATTTSKLDFFKQSLQKRIDNDSSTVVAYKLKNEKQGITVVYTSASPSISQLDAEDIDTDTRTIASMNDISKPIFVQIKDSSGNIIAQDGLSGSMKLVK